MNEAATIPMPGDVSAMIGTAAEHVENRSLLLDKFVFHKSWPVVEDYSLKGRKFIKWDDASRWSFMRIANGASSILSKDAHEKRRKANGQNTSPENQARYKAEAKIAETLATVRWDNKNLQELRARHTRNFLGLFRRAYRERASVTIGQLEGRLAINLSSSLIQNAGICLDRLFGLPYIPGSAVKGVCRHAALTELKAAEPEEVSQLVSLFCAVFGTSENDFKSGDLNIFQSHLRATNKDQKGAISFLPAYPVNEAHIVVDLTNVHYPSYYSSGQKEELANENPRPNPFPAVEVGAQFAFCLVQNGMDNRPEVLAAAKRWLEVALTERGIGAKTAAGYGWFSLQPHVLSDLEKKEAEEYLAAEARVRAAEEAAQKAQEEKELKATLSPEALAMENLLELSNEQFADFAKELASKEEIQQRAFIHLLRNNKDKRERWKTWKKKKADLAAGIQQVANKLNLPPLP